MENPISAAEWSQLSVASLKFYRPLVAGRAAELRVYSYIYSQFENFLERELRVSIFDQVADIDDVDFCIRVESASFVGYFDCQVKSSSAGKWTLSKRFLELLEKRAHNGMLSFLFLVDTRENGSIFSLTSDQVLNLTHSESGLLLTISKLPTDLKSMFQIISGLAR